MPGSTNSAASSGASKWEPPSVERLQELLPQYEITALIGRGGMGAVYKGVQTTLGRTVAIKLLPESLQEDAGDAGFVERFKLEARAMASLDHPAIISVFDFGQTSEGHLYFVMEFIDGMDLQQYLNASGGKLEVEAAVAIISHVLDALEYAHKKGIVHRDIKPANVLINSEGRVKIADFGLAKQIGGEASGLTMSNVAMGTPDFIAPEAMLDSASSDGRADLYAVGVMLYQMLTGKLPRGMFKLPSEEDASFDPRFDDIIASALEPNPEHRFSAAKDFRKKLDELRSQPVSKIEGRSTIERRGAKTQDVTPAVKRGLPTRPAAKKSGGGVMWAVVAVALLGGGGWLIWGGKKGGGPEPTEVPPAEFWDASSSAAGSKKGESGQKDAAPRTQQADATWPSDDHYRSAGRFRAWSSIPNDPQMDISALAKLTSVKQVEVHRAGWVFIRDDGTLKANSNGADGMGSVARIERGYNQRFATIDIDGTLRLWPILKAQEKIADGIGPVVSAFHCDDFVAAVTRDGQLEIRGKAFDDPSAENKNRWIDRPQLDPNDRVVGLAACDECLAVRLSTGDIRIWRPDGRRFSPPNGFLEGDLNDCAVNRASLFVSMGPGNTVKSLITRNDPPTHGVERDFTGIETFESTQLGMAGITSDQRLLIHSSLADSFPDLIEVAKKVKDPQPDLISIFASPDFGARLLWFEPEEPPIPEGAASAKETPAPPQTVPKPSPAPKPRIDGLVANGEWQDMMPGMTHPSRITNGEWTSSVPVAKSDPRLRCLIGLPTEALASYELRTKILHAADEGTNDSRYKSLVFTLPTAAGTVKLVTSVDSNTALLRHRKIKPSAGEDPPNPVPPNVLRPGKVQEWFISMQADRMTVTLDGLPFTTWENVEWSEFEQGGMLDPPEPYLGVISDKSTRTEIHSLEIRVPDATPPNAQSDSAAAKAVEKIEGVQSRIANFQKARHQQLADLTGKYQKALASAKTAASKAGNAAHEKAIQLAMSRAANFAKEIEKLPATKTVAPLAALPALDASTPDALKKLRRIFDAETAKIEADLLAKLDQSLAAFQTSMLEAGDLEVVDALRAYRKAIARPEVGGKTGAVGLGAPRLVSVDQIWNNAPHNGYTDLLFHSGKWFCVFREGSRATSTDGSLRVITPGDEGRWATLAQFTSAGEDLRDPTVSVTPDGRLMISCRAIGRGSKPATKVWFSEDAGTTWSEGIPIGKAGFWVWRPQWHQGFCYSISYEVDGACTATLCRSGDGLNFAPISAPRRIGAQYGEDTILFLPDQSALCLFRNFDGDQTTGLGTAQPPYKEWDWKPLNQQVAGPNMIQLQDGRVIVATRLSDGETRTSLAWLDPGKSTLGECLKFPSGGSTGYAGLVWKDGLLWISYYSSHEGKASIYLAKVAFDATSSPQQTHENGGATKATDGPSASTTTEPFENSLGMKFVPVPIQGGSTDGQALLFSVWETRVQDYEVFVKQTKRKWPKPDFPQGPDHPAVMVSWEDATAFCDWLTQRERQAGTIGTDQVYRLPSDHEWSCAAGIAGGENAVDTPERKLAGVSKLYPWGRDWPPPNGSGNYNGQETLRNPFDGTPMGGYNDGFDRTAPVGSFAPTTSGLYDLGGNVVEWCSDRWDGKASTAKTVLRGGSWRDGQERFHLSSFRFGMPANQSDDRAGFRCVLAPIGGATASNEDRWIDLIAAVDPVKDVSTRNNWRADQNLWEKQGSDLVFLESNSSGEILLPNTENITDFEIRMAMTRESGTRGIDFKIPTPGGATPIIFGGNTGSQLKGNPRPFNFVSHPLTTGQKMEVVVTVRSTGTNAGIKVEADGKPIIDWKGDYRSDLGVIDNYQSKRIGLWIGLPPTSDPVSKFRFHEILFQPL